MAGPEHEKRLNAQFELLPIPAAAFSYVSRQHALNPFFFSVKVVICRYIGFPGCFYRQFLQHIAEFHFI